MPFIEADLDQDYEDKLAPEGRYDLRIEAATEKRSKAGADMIECRIMIEGEEGIAPIWHYLVMPVSTKQAKDRSIEPDDDNKRRNKMRSLTRFLTMFGVKFDPNGFNSEDLVGATAKQADVSQEQPEGWDTPQNVLKLPPVVG